MRIFWTAGRKSVTTINRMNAPIPIPGVQFVAGFENNGVDVAVDVIVGVKVCVLVGVVVGVEV
jgi:ABC-type microcin C transport system permease subunit YejE